MEQINAEFSSLITTAGKLEYQIFAFERDLAALNEKLLGLNLEAAALMKANEEKKANE